MRVLVLGGTGYVGRRVTERLVDRGDMVTVVSRGNLHPDVLDRVEHLRLDRQERRAFEDALQRRRFDAVVDIIAYAREDVASVMRALGERAGHYIFISSMAVYHNRPPTRPVRETDADLRFVPGEDDPVRQQVDSSRGYTYTLEKRRAELLLFENAGGSFPFTSLRAPVVVGPDDRTQRIWWFVQRILDGGPIIIPDSAQVHLFQVVTADDLVKACLASIGNHAAVDHAYNIAQADIFTPETWIEALATALGRATDGVRIPEPLLERAGLGDYVLPIAGRPGHFLTDISAARRDLGFEPAPLEEWAADCARGCASSPPNAGSSGYDRRERETAVARSFEAMRHECWQQFATEW